MRAIPIKIYPVFFLVIALGLILMPIRWLVAWLIAASFHELCHIISLILCRRTIYSVKIGAFGAKIEADMPDGISGILCAMAGPLGGLLLLSCLRAAPRVALCGLLQSLYNLIPIYPFDGGRALLALTSALFGNKKGYIIFKWIEYIFLLSLCMLCGYVMIKFQFGIIPMLIALLIFIRNKNIPCKQSLLRVQYR